ncbi:MAG: twin-arginine translocation signal domain-containing protein [Verrucomicrobiota bacterium]
MINRREFLGTTAAGGALFASGLFGPRLLASDTGQLAKPPPVKIYKIFAGRTGDFYLAHPTEELARFNQYFNDLEKKLGDVQFVGGDMIPPAEAAQLAEKVKAADAVLLIHLSAHGGDAPVLSKIVDVGLPTALFTQPFSGHGWMYFPQWRKQGKRVVLLPSSDWTEIERVVALMRVPAWLKQTRIIAWGPPQGTEAACSAERLKERFGAELISVTDARVKDIWKSIDPAAAQAEAEQYWLSQARQIVEPSRQEIIASAKLFLAVKQLMIQEKAQAIASSCCMGDPRGCLTFSKLNDLGFVGACEGDMDSTLTMLLFAYAFRVPGFISDPVVDTAKNALVHFHCTSATKMDGPLGRRLPFTIRTQTDSKGGVALQVENRIGQPVTCAKLVNLDTLLITPGKILETSTSPLACRTQFAMSVPNAKRLFLNWGGDVIKGGVMTLLHRVVFYGDYLEPMKNLGDLMGFKVLEESGVA